MVQCSDFYDIVPLLLECEPTEGKDYVSLIAAPQCQAEWLA